MTSLIGKNNKTARQNLSGTDKFNDFNKIIY